MSSALLQWEKETTGRMRRALREAFAAFRRPLSALILALVAFVSGVYAGSNPKSPLADLELRSRLREAETALKARQGELDLARIELARTRSIMEYSSKYSIPADLAQAIYDIALSEGIDPGLAYWLV